MADYAVIDAGERLFYLTHGHIFHIENLPPLQKGDILIYGHTHIPLCGEKDGVLCLNPGSVSIPKNGTPHSYMIFEDGVFYWKDLDGGVYQISENRE